MHFTYFQIINTINEYYNYSIRQYNYYHNYSIGQFNYYHNYYIGQFDYYYNNYRPISWLSISWKSADNRNTYSNKFLGK